MVPDQAPAAQRPGKATVADGFERFYAAYPKRVGKGAARKAWAKALARASAETIIAGAVRYAQDPNLAARGGPDWQYVPGPGPWLNADRWEDEPLPPRGQAPTSAMGRTVALLAQVGAEAEHAMASRAGAIEVGVVDPMAALGFGAQQ